MAGLPFVGTRVITAEMPIGKVTAKIEDKR